MRLMTMMILLAVVLFGGCNNDQASSSSTTTQTAATPPPAAIPAPATTAETATQPKTGIGLANPASVNCGKQGGKTVIRKDAKGGEVGYCVFKDGSECEEWALMRGKCKPGQNKPAAPGTKPSATVSR
jgi:putative hemolysin